MIPNAAYREVTDDDMQAIFDVRVATWHNDRGLEELTSMGITHDSVRAMMKDTHRGWLCEIDDRVIGFAMGDKSNGEMWVIAVLEAFEDGGTARIHQEDFCQALGLPPERKYQAEGGPTLQDCTSLLREWSSVPVLDVPRFVDGLILNVVIGNADAHGKNLSFVYAGQARRLSPSYDLVSTIAWPEFSGNLAMRIGGSKSIHTFTAGDWRKMARKCGLGWPMVRERMARTCEAVLGELDAIRTLTGGYDAKMVGRLHGLIGERANGLLRSLSELDH